MNLRERDEAIRVGLSEKIDELEKFLNEVLQSDNLSDKDAPFVVGQLSVIEIYKAILSRRLEW
jgi:hypothetical protein